MKKTGVRYALCFGGLIVLLFLLLVMNVNTGSVSISLGDILRIVFLGEGEGEAAYNVIWKIRLPRLLTAALMGGALSVSGFLLQTFFRNPIAGPYVLGISSSAKLMVGLVLVFGRQLFGRVSFGMTMLAAFAGAMLCTGLVLAASRRVHSMAMLLVVGVMVGNICSAATDFVVTFAQEAEIANLHSWSMGSFSAVSWDNLKACALPVLAALILSVAIAKPISAFQLGEGYAASVGVNVRVYRVALILLSSVLSACVTALVGPISFVGIAVPHVTKRLFGTARPQVITPGCFLLGGVFCLMCDLIARTAFAPTELAISSVTALFGAPVVIGLMLKRGGERA